MTAILTNISLSHSLSLAALSIILIPIILHILNPNKAIIIWVAHIDFIREGKLKRVFQVKWLDKLLLTLRLLIVCLLALMLAEPFYMMAPTFVNEQHVLISDDWLSNAKENDSVTVLEKYNSFQNVSFFQLEKAEVPYRDFVSLRNAFLKNSKISNSAYNSSQDYINDLAQRRKVPKTTDIYITNRETNFNSKSLNIDRRQGYQLNVLSLPIEHIERKPVIKILGYDNTNAQYRFAVKLIKIALEALNIKVEIKALVTHTGGNAKATTTAASLNNEADLLFVLGKRLRNVNEHDKAKLIDVKPSVNGLTFFSNNRKINDWNKENPNDLLVIISQLIESLPMSLAQNRVSADLFQPSTVETQLKDNLDGIPHSKSLLKYVIFLICLLWLAERRLTLGACPRIGNRLRKSYFGQFSLSFLLNRTTIRLK